jgi:hypothetical protein
MQDPTQEKHTESWAEYLKDKQKIEPEVPEVVVDIRKSLLRKSNSEFTSTKIKNPNNVRRSFSNIVHAEMVKKNEDKELEV